MAACRFLRRASAGSALPALPALLALVALLATLLAPSACAQQIVLTNTRKLDFGRFVAGSGGSVAVAPSGLRSRTGGVVLLNSPTAGQASFNVTRNGNGGANKAVAISLPANNSVRLTSRTGSMPVASFASTPTSLPSIPNGGTTLAIGATLVVAPNQAPGTYAGNFSVIVNFQ